jgi:hypothetical protein
MLIATALLVSGTARAQSQVESTSPSPSESTAAAQTQAPAAPAGFTGTVDLGGLFTSTDGDAARYERYRDTRNGLYSSFNVRRSSESFLFGANASHVGYRDQRYNATFIGRRVSANFGWVSLPLNYSYLTRTAFTTNGSVLTLDDAAQRAVQGPTISPTDGTAVGVPCAPGAPPGHNGRTSPSLIGSGPGACAPAVPANSTTATTTAQSSLIPILSSCDWRNVTVRLPKPVRAYAIP